MILLESLSSQELMQQQKKFMDLKLSAKIISFVKLKVSTLLENLDQ